MDIVCIESERWRNCLKLLAEKKKHISLTHIHRMGEERRIVFMIVSPHG
jgi:hypothetical protein